VLASSALLAFYVLIAILLGGAASRLSPESGFVWFAIAALLAAFLFAPLRARIQEQLDRRFYKGEYDYRQSMADFGRALASEIDLMRLTERVRARVSRSLDVPEVALFLRSASSGDLFQRVDTDPASAFHPRFEIQAPAAAFADPDSDPASPASSLSEDAARFRGELDALGLRYIEPLRAHGRLLGFLAFGEKADRRMLSSEDLDLVAGLANYLAIALDNALLYQSLERKARELEQLKLYSENVVESLVAGVVALTPEGEITVWNSAMRVMSGVETEQAVGRNIEQTLQPELIERIRDGVGGPGWMVQEASELSKVRLASLSGEERLVNVTLAPFVFEGEVNTGTLLLFEDVTEKTRLEGQLAQAEKLSSIGLFAAGVAHEVNTPLAGISSYAQMLLKDAPEGSAQRELLAKIEKQSFRASGIVNSLLKFARVSDTELQAVNLNSLMLDTISLLEHQLKKSQVEVCLDLDPSLPATLGNGGRLQQVFMNLFLNARDAMPDGGQLRVCSYQRDSAVVVEVRDTGQGIPPEDVKRIYDPFFTTKAVGKGTGLGLSVSYGIIQEHSGRISVASHAGKGTTFTVELPLKRVN
jgi:two-component system NtrC family sensor kinase